ncbi:vitelline membrane outer layer 1 homolog b isoform X2 [Brachyhypopomus gauderio]|uniref:vitelline membrane outer layer 1 homolog b isoform X2 n=2 Tax=Brachyhypopomus gauderio TaxID=698409 RepID=UPI004040EF68
MGEVRGDGGGPWCWTTQLDSEPQLNSSASRTSSFESTSSGPVRSRKNSAPAPMNWLGFVPLVLLVCWSDSRASGPRAERSIDRPFLSLLIVDNGQRWGTWGLREMCPLGFYAAGFSLKVAGYWESLLIGDNTALNGIRLHCVNTAKGTSGPHTDYATVQSDTGRFRCGGGEELQGAGTAWGSWGSWSDTCRGKGVCGIQTIVEEPRGLGDDTALNDVRLFCCD